MWQKPIFREGEDGSRRDLQVGIQAWERRSQTSVGFFLTGALAIKKSAGRTSSRLFLPSSPDLLLERLAILSSFHINTTSREDNGKYRGAFVCGSFESMLLRIFDRTMFYAALFKHRRPDERRFPCPKPRRQYSRTLIRGTFFLLLPTMLPRRGNLSDYPSSSSFPSASESTSSRPPSRRNRSAFQGSALPQLPTLDSQLHTSSQDSYLPPLQSLSLNSLSSFGEFTSTLPRYPVSTESRFSSRNLLSTASSSRPLQDSPYPPSIGSASFHLPPLPPLTSLESRRRKRQIVNCICGRSRRLMLSAAGNVQRLF